MLDIDPSMAWHKLNVNLEARYISHLRRRQSIENADAVAKTVQAFLDVNFILEAKYTEWLL